MPARTQTQRPAGAGRGRGQPGPDPNARPREPRPAAALGLWRGVLPGPSPRPHHERPGCTHLELPDVPLGHQVMLVLRREAIGQSLGEGGEGGGLSEAQDTLPGAQHPPRPEIRATCYLALKFHMNGGREHV